MLIHNETPWATLHFVLLLPRKVLCSCCQMREVVQWLDGWESLIWSRHLIWLCCVTYQQWLPVKSVHAKSNNRGKKSAVCTFVVVFTHPFSGSRSLSCPHELINDCKGGCERRMVVLLQHDLLHLWAQPQSWKGQWKIDSIWILWPDQRANLSSCRNKFLLIWHITSGAQPCYPLFYSIKWVITAKLIRKRTTLTKTLVRRSA